MQRRERLRVEPGSHFPGEEKFLPFEITDQECAEMLPGALGWSEATDNELLFVHALEFDPGATAPPRFVNRIAHLADQALQSAPLYFLQQLCSIPADLAGIADRIAEAITKSRQNFLPRRQRKSGKTSAVKLHQIEDVKDNGRVVALHLQPLEQWERRSPFLIQRHDFAIEDAVIGRNLFKRLHHIGKPVSQFITIARDKIDLRSILDRANTKPVELQLVTPIT